MRTHWLDREGSCGVALLPVGKAQNSRRLARKGFEVLNVGAAVLGGVAPIALICGDRLFSLPAAIAGIPPTIL